MAFLYLMKTNLREMFVLVLLRNNLKDWKAYLHKYRYIKNYTKYFLKNWKMTMKIYIKMKLFYGENITYNKKGFNELELWIKRLFLLSAIQLFKGLSSGYDIDIYGSTNLEKKLYSLPDIVVFSSKWNFEYENEKRDGHLKLFAEHIHVSFDMPRLRRISW